MAPNHRINRGMGGSKKRNHPANYVLLCSRMNGLIESDVEAAEQAIRFGWKLNSWNVPEESPVFDNMSGVWYLLENDWSRKVAG